MIQEVRYRARQGQPQRWKMEASSEFECSSWKALADGSSSKDPCPDEITVVTIPSENMGLFFCYRFHFCGGEEPADIQMWRRITYSGKLDDVYRHMQETLLFRCIYHKR